MSDDVFRQARKKITSDELATSSEDGNPLDKIAQMREAVAKEVGQEAENPFRGNDLPFQVSGNIPPQFRQMLQQNSPGTSNEGVPLNPSQRNLGGMPQQTGKPKPRSQPQPVPDTKVNQLRNSGSEEFEAVLAKLAGAKFLNWEPVEIPSLGKFYDGIPGTLHVRPMTGEEEQILATPRFVRKGKAIDMIFEKCIREPIKTQELLSVDRTYLLIYLRGISYTPEYDVEVKCPGCGNKFPSTINLSDIDVDYCPDNFDLNSLNGTLPTSGLKYRFRLATGEDEQTVARYRDIRVKEFGDQGEDDTLLYRTALLLVELEGVTDKQELNLLLKKLPINDVAHLRNAVSEPPFGVGTEIGQVCPFCTNEFEIDLPLEANFFFPRKKKVPTHQ